MEWCRCGNYARFFFGFRELSNAPRQTSGSLVPVVSVRRGEERLHVLDEGAGDGGRQVKLLADHHCLASAQDRWSARRVFAVPALHLCEHRVREAKLSVPQIPG